LIVGLVSERAVDFRSICSWICLPLTTTAVTVWFWTLRGGTKSGNDFAPTALELAVMALCGCISTIRAVVAKN